MLMNLRHLRVRLPSLWSAAAALLIGVVVSYFFHYLATHYDRSFERILWSWWQRLGWWWWGIPIASSAIGIYHTARLDRPQTRYGFVTRIMFLMAFVSYIGSWENTGLGPLAAILTSVASTMLIRQQALVCAARRDRPSYKGEPFMVRLFAALTTELDHVKAGQP